jgi:hypothetical protein
MIEFKPGNFDGRLYGGRLFAGRLFRHPRKPIGGGAGREDDIDERMQSLHAEDESLLFALGALVASRRLH